MQFLVYSFPDPETKQRDIPVENDSTSNFAQAQEVDESLKHVRRWVRQKKTPTQNDFQGLPHLGWQMYNQLDSLYNQDGILGQKFELTDGRSAYLPQIVPSSLVTEVITSLRKSLTAGRLGAYKSLEENRPWYYWPGFKTEIRHHISRCDKCQNDLAFNRSTEIRS